MFGDIIVIIIITNIAAGIVLSVRIFQDVFSHRFYWRPGRASTHTVTAVTMLMLFVVLHGNIPLYASTSSLNGNRVLVVVAGERYYGLLL